MKLCAYDTNGNLVSSQEVKKCEELNHLTGVKVMADDLWKSAWSRNDWGHRPEDRALGELQDKLSNLARAGVAVVKLEA